MRKMRASGAELQPEEKGKGLTSEPKQLPRSPPVETQRGGSGREEQDRPGGMWGSGSREGGHWQGVLSEDSQEKRKRETQGRVGHLGKAFQAGRVGKCCRKRWWDAKRDGADKDRGKWRDGTGIMGCFHSRMRRKGAEIGGLKAEPEEHPEILQLTEVRSKHWSFNTNFRFCDLSETTKKSVLNQLWCEH